MYNKYIRGELPENIKLPTFLAAGSFEHESPVVEVPQPAFKPALKFDQEDLLIIGLILLLLGEEKEWDIILILAAILLFGKH